MNAFELDAFGLPRGHYDGLELAARELAEFVSELPESTYKLDANDAECAASRVIHQYLFALRHAEAVK